MPKDVYNRVNTVIEELKVCNKHGAAELIDKIREIRNEAISCEQHELKKRTEMLQNKLEEECEKAEKFLKG